MRHPGYCLVFLDVSPIEAAEVIRSILRHKLFRTQAQRMGKVICVDKDRLTYWQVSEQEIQQVKW